MSILKEYKYLYKQYLNRVLDPHPPYKANATIDSFVKIIADMWEQINEVKRKIAFNMTKYIVYVNFIGSLGSV